jgi:hypothetical protein
MTDTEKIKAIKTLIDQKHIFLLEFRAEVEQIVNS